MYPNSVQQIFICRNHRRWKVKANLLFSVSFLSPYSSRIVLPPSVRHPKLHSLISRAKGYTVIGDKNSTGFYFGKASMPAGYHLLVTIHTHPVPSAGDLVVFTMVLFSKCPAINVCQVKSKTKEHEVFLKDHTSIH